MKDLTPLHSHCIPDPIAFPPLRSPSPSPPFFTLCKAMSEERGIIRS